MDRKDAQGEFSRNLFSLQLQISSLLEGAGGNQTAKLLDSLAEFSSSESEVVLRVFQRALDKCKDSEFRFRTAEEQQLQQFESILYDELVDGMTAISESAAQTISCDGSAQKSPLGVIDGGKLPTRKKSGKQSKVQCLQTARKKKRKAQQRIN